MSTVRIHCRSAQQQQQHDDDDTAATPPSSSSNDTLVEDDDDADTQQDQPVDDKQGSVDRSAGQAEENPAAPNGTDDNAAAAIRETVASAGAQGDEFRSESLTTADARGAVEATEGTEPALQSASAKKPVSAGSASEPERQPEEEAAHDAAVKKELVASVEEVAAEQQRSLAGFLDDAFVAATDGGFAPLDLPVTTDSVSQEEKGDAMVSSAQQEEVKVTTVPGAVDASPVADLSWREKKGWWSPNPDLYDDSTAVRSASTTPPPPPLPNPSAAGPAAVEPAQSQGVSKDEILLRFPPWKPTNNHGEKRGDQTPVKEMVKPDEVKPLADFLPSAFVAALPPSPEGESATPISSNAETVTPKEEEEAGGEKKKKKKTSSQQQQSGSALSSFLSGSFSATGPPTPLEAPVTITVGEDEDEDEVPLNAEAIVAEPPLSDILDVDAIEDGKVGVDQPEEEEKKEKKKKHGWWSPDYVPPEQSATTSSDAHQTGTGLVDDQLVQDTVGTAGAQGDEFRAESYSNADRAGVAQLEPASASAQSAVPAASSSSQPEQQQQKKEREDGSAVKESVVEQGEPERARTPIGQFLDQAFSARSPSDSVQEQNDNKTGTTRGDTETTSPSATEASGSSSATSTPRASAVSETAPTASSASSSSQAPPRRRRSSSSPSPPPSPRRTSSHGQDDDEQQSPPHHKAADEAPSLTLAIASAWHTAPWSRKLWAVLASVAINVGLPFINGVMLGAFPFFLKTPFPFALLMSRKPPECA